jgi:hypothetical protein
VRGRDNFAMICETTAELCRSLRPLDAMKEYD